MAAPSKRLVAAARWELDEASGVQQSRRLITRAVRHETELAEPSTGTSFIMTASSSSSSLLVGDGVRVRSVLLRLPFRVRLDSSQNGGASSNGAGWLRAQTPRRNNRRPMTADDCEKGTDGRTTGTDSRISESDGGCRGFFAAAHGLSVEGRLKSDRGARDDART